MTRRGNPVVLFQGTRLLLIGDPFSGGALTTHKRYADFTESIAHVMEDGRILRYAELIGTAHDITLTGERE